MVIVTIAYCTGILLENKGIGEDIIIYAPEMTQNQHEMGGEVRLHCTCKVKCRLEPRDKTKKNISYLCPIANKGELLM